MRKPCEYHANALETGNDTPLQSGRFPLPIVARKEKEKRRERGKKREQRGRQGDQTNYEDISEKMREEDESRRERKKGMRRIRGKQKKTKSIGSL